MVSEAAAGRGLWLARTNSREGLADGGVGVVVNAGDLGAEGNGEGGGDLVDGEVVQHDGLEVALRLRRALRSESTREAGATTRLKAVRNLHPTW